jgi:hypothetical protein
VWTERYEKAFQQIKELIVSRCCLTTINHDDMGNNCVFVTCDASTVGTGAVLTYGETWETACPVTFESRPLTGVEKHYPTHEQELLVIVCALKKWWSDLLGIQFDVYTDHKTLLNFNKQHDLSKRQARWMEFLADYNYTIHYLPGTTNTVADALSRVLTMPTHSLSDPVPITCSFAAAVFSVVTDSEFLDSIKRGYEGDMFATKLQSMMTAGSHTNLGVHEEAGLLYVNNRLVIPKVPHLCEQLFQLAHDALGHFGTDKSYGALHGSFFWPEMHPYQENVISLNSLLMPLISLNMLN